MVWFLFALIGLIYLLITRESRMTKEKEVIVKTQSQLEKISPDYEGTIYLEGGTYEKPLILTRNFEYAYVIARGSAVLEMRESSQVKEMWGSSQVKEMWESSQVNVMRESSQVNVMWGSSQVNVMWGSSQVNEMWGSSQVKEMWGSSQVKEMWESSQVNEMWESSQVNVMWGSSQVNVMWGSSQVKEMWGSSQVKEMWESSQVNVMRESSQVNVMWGSSQVKEMWGSSQVKDLYGEAMVSAYGMNSLTCHGNNIIRTKESNKKNLVVVMNKDSHLIVLPDFKPIFADYAKNFPVVVNKTKAILYKSVHKRGGEYFSDYDSSFKYEIGVKMKSNIDKSTSESCSIGMHVAHKSWAIQFGITWSDMALLECEVPVKSIVVAEDTDGKVRTSELTVLREVPKNEYDN